MSTTASAASPVLPGGYSIIAMGADPDYTISYQPGILLITPAPLTITANNASMVQGTAIPPLSVSYNGFVNGDSPREPGHTADGHDSSHPTQPGGYLSHRGGRCQFPELRDQLCERRPCRHPRAGECFECFDPGYSPGQDQE